LIVIAVPFRFCYAQPDEKDIILVGKELQEENYPLGKKLS
jgi:hypothetical protein